MLLQVSAKIGHSFDKTKTQVKNDSSGGGSGSSSSSGGGGGGSSSSSGGGGGSSSSDHLTPCRLAPTPTSLQSA